MSFIHSIRRHIPLDSAGLIASASRLAASASQLLLLLLIPRFLSPAEQGFYFSFAGVAQIGLLLDLGMGIITVNFMSHEWAFLAIDPAGRVTGDTGALGRLAGLIRFFLAWYTAMTLLFILLVCGGGILFFSAGNAQGVDWLAPWIGMVVIYSCNILLLPLYAVLEGTGAPGSAFRIRLEATLLSTGSAGIALALGAGLWTGAILNGVIAIVSILRIFGLRRVFFSQMLREVSAARVPWRQEILPMQYQTGIQALVGFLTYSIYAPLAYQLQGPVVAGQVGMTWALCGGLAGPCIALVQVRVYRWGGFVARHEFDALDHDFRRASRLALAAYSLVCLGFLSVLYQAERFWPMIAERVLPLDLFVIFMIGVGANQVTNCIAFYLRSHRREPFAVLGTVASVVNGLAVTGLGILLGPLGMALGYMLGCVVVSVPWALAILKRCRRTWQDRNPMPSTIGSFHG